MRRDVIPIGGLLCTLLVGCSLGPAVRSLPAPAAEGPAEPRSHPDASMPVLIGQTLVYPVRWGRAEELAATLGPYLQARFGPGTRVVPQRESNSLLIYLPPRRELRG